MEYEVDIDAFTQEIILASSKHDIDHLNALLQIGSANVQDSESGYTPLHAAVAACEGINASSEKVLSKKCSEPRKEQEQGDVAAAEKTVQLLFQNGAIWNDLDGNDETPGCIAFRIGLKTIYELIVDAGVRAELLLNRLAEYEVLESGSDSVEEQQDNNYELHASVQYQSQLTQQFPGHFNPSNEEYLHASIEYKENQLVDKNQNGVMMAWEAQIMQLTADELLPQNDLACLNIGYGMGIIDKFFQAKGPKTHHIVEAHPDVLKYMQDNGWFEKSNVVVHQGRWQDVLPVLVKDSMTFDAIYFDTFAEDYNAFKNFFSEYVIQLLNPVGKWSFFNGLGADRRVCYDVYAKVVEIDLLEAGFDVSWKTLSVPEQADPSTWKGIQRRYWTLDEYKLPTCNFVE